ncbi:hypothetical protein MNV49_003191 [Pseudohyphozyma bogoriensis]|nr:hypothetical protein MNV49_003191 [Pseudohyphozyma bogoriensis]
MSDTPAGTELARKRSRSSSPSLISGIDSPAASKKANIESSAPSNLSTVSASDDASAKNNGADDAAKPAVTGEDAPMPDQAAASTATSADASAAAPAPMETDLPANPTAATSEADAAAAAAAAASQTIQMRALIVTQDASIIIGKGGKNVNEIREKSGSKITITESVPGNPERVMMIGGQLDAVSKAFGLVVRRINDEPFDVPSVPGSRAVTIRFIIPNQRMGSVIGKGGSKIKEIQEASGARLQASEAMLPGSTERVLSVSGVADAIHIAVYYIGTILQEHATTSTSSSNTSSYRPSASSGGYGGGERRTGGGGGGGGAYGGAPSGGPAPPAPGSQTQQIYIPNDLVGSIIGKAGAKINEIRQQSQCQIKICEPGESSPGANPLERLVMITGQPAGIQVAVRLLYQRLEQERDKKL